MIRYYILIALACLFTSCNHSPNGRYVVTAFNAGDYGDGQITESLKHSMFNRQFDIKFDTLTATSLSSTTHELYSFRRLHAKTPTYLSSFIQHGVSYQVFLIRSTPLLMRINMFIPQPKSPVDTTHSPSANGGASIMDLTKNGSTTVTLVCHLEKVDN